WGSPCGSATLPAGRCAMPKLRWVLAILFATLLAAPSGAQQVKTYAVPKGAHPHDVAADPRPGGPVWYTAQQQGALGRPDPATGAVQVWDAPRGRGTYGIAVTPSGDIWYASLAGNHIARIDRKTGIATPVDPPTPGQGARRIWSDSQGRLWVSEWNSGQ